MRPRPLDAPRPVATGPLICLVAEVDGSFTELRSLTDLDRARLFARDRELQRFARLLAEAHALALSGVVPRSVRRTLCGIVDQLDALLHGAPHLESR